MELKKLDQDFSVCKVKDYSLVDLGAECCFIGKADEEGSLVCATSDVPSNVVERDDGWKGFRIQGVLDFSLIGILTREPPGKTHPDRSRESGRRQMHALSPRY